MDKADKIKVKQLISKIANKYGVPLETVEKIVSSPYMFTYEKLKDYDYDKVESEEEANALKTNFNYKGIGKLYFSWPALVTRKKRIDNALKLNKRNGRS